MVSWVGRGIIVVFRGRMRKSRFREVELDINAAVREFFLVVFLVLFSVRSVE